MDRKLKEDFEMAFALIMPVVTGKMLQNYFLTIEIMEKNKGDNYNDRNSKFYLINLFSYNILV